MVVGSDGQKPSTLKNMFGLITVMAWCMLQATATAGVEASPDTREDNGLREIRTGVLAHDVEGLWSNSRKEGGIDLNAEVILNRPSFSFLFGTVTPSFGVSVNDRGDTSKLYGGLVWEREMESAVFLNLGFGAALHNGKLETSNEDKKALGSRILFRIQIELGFSINKHHRVSVLFDHVSNAHLADPNEGLDTFGLRYGFRFQP